ncbi:hypothetical protein FNF31_05820 [Cafeteria roenbergensis]|uniref:PSP proline-rich domain-containing protein n=1 Tax=Cafeteria roenbergensis TaxID=33653 RepID=A0A5A8D666_CAFRO|nr:hypothetical protein FNF31_05820 [Cafeteria roenbergensis]KAA0160117.1 hypothetical protein FNF28_05545 [Cafeteria roenbergensis]
MADATASNGAPGADAEPQLTAAGIGSLSAQELVTELAKRGAPTSGNDGELRGRLMKLAGLSAAAPGGSRRSTRNRKRRQQRKATRAAEAAEAKAVQETPSAPAADASGDDDPVEVVYRSSIRASDLAGSEFAELAEVVGKFASAEELTGGEAPEAEASGTEETRAGQTAAGGSADEPDTDDEDDEWELDELGNPLQGDGVSNRQRRRLTRLSVAELKSRAAHPEVVELHDTAAADPTLLVHAKAYRHSVPVPALWRQKRKYLMGRRALEKTTFELPKFIKDTGIADVRDRALEEDAQKSLKQKMRDKVRPKLGRVAVDYEVLHDAFFRHQTKPRLSAHGEVYYEGKDSEKDHSHFRPGVISARLREALALPAGHPPPWLVQMQRYGPPPSYPQLKIAGLNAPIPEGASWGFQPGQWGMVPVDMAGKPLYGDPFAAPEEAEAAAIADASLLIGAPSVPRRWGEVDSDAEDDMGGPGHGGDDDDDDDGEGEGGGRRAADDGVLHADEQDEVPDEAELAAAAAAAAGGGPTDQAAGGTESTIPGAETPSSLDLRKAAAPAPAAPARPLFQVLSQVDAADDAGVMSGAARKYVLPAEGDPAAASAASAAAVALLSKAEARAPKRARGPGTTVSLDLAKFDGLTPEEVERMLLQSREHEEDERRRAEIDEMLAQHQRSTAAKRRKREKKDNDFF